MIQTLINVFDDRLIVRFDEALAPMIDAPVYRRLMREVEGLRGFEEIRVKRYSVVIEYANHILTGREFAENVKGVLTSQWIMAMLADEHPGEDLVVTIVG